MFNSLYHAEIGGGYTLRRKIIINAADLRPLGGQIEVAALIENGDELNSATVTTEADALAAFHSMIQQYAEPLQKLWTPPDWFRAGNIPLCISPSSVFPSWRKSPFKAAPSPPTPSTPTLCA